MKDALTRKPKLLMTRCNVKASGLCNNYLSYKSSISSKVSEEKKQKEKGNDVEKWLMGTNFLSP